MILISGGRSTILKKAVAGNMRIRLYVVQPREHAPKVPEKKKTTSEWRW